MGTGWNYGDAGDRYRVEPGSVWEVGPHVLACHDLHDGVPDLPRADAVYTDPPWNAGNEASFRTKAGLTTSGKPPDGRWADFCADLVNTLDWVCPDGPWFIEGTQVRRHEGGPYDDLVEMVRGHDRQEQAEWRITYYRKHPAVLGLFVKDQVDMSLLPEFDGQDDDDTPGLAMGAAFPDCKTWFDPCLGRGLTAVSAHALGLICVGTELHPRRLAVTIDRLVKLEAGTARRIR